MRLFFHSLHFYTVKKSLLFIMYWLVTNFSLLFIMYWLVTNYLSFLVQIVRPASNPDFNNRSTVLHHHIQPEIRSGTESTSNPKTQQAVYRFYIITSAGPFYLDRALKLGPGTTFPLLPPSHCEEIYQGINWLSTCEAFSIPHRNRVVARHTATQPIDILCGLVVC